VGHVECRGEQKSIPRCGWKTRKKESRLGDLGPRWDGNIKSILTGRDGEKVD